MLLAFVDLGVDFQGTPTLALITMQFLRTSKPFQPRTLFKIIAMLLAARFRGLDGSDRAAQGDSDDHFTYRCATS